MVRSKGSVPLMAQGSDAAAEASLRSTFFPRAACFSGTTKER